MLIYMGLLTFVVLLFVPPFVEEMRLRKVAEQLRQIKEQVKEQKEVTREASVLLHNTAPRSEASFDAGFARRESLSH